MQSKQQTEETLEKDIPPIDMNNIHYYSCEEEFKINSNKNEAMEQYQSSTITHEKEDDNVVF